ncbi:MAG: hypothetical protein F6K16_38470 [Symploca sp. SIO2B6]|nr:hypothetical protein [Symploca sp. SIO2B6]
MIPTFLSFWGDRTDQSRSLGASFSWASSHAYTQVLSSPVIAIAHIINFCKE